MNQNKLLSANPCSFSFMVASTGAFLPEGVNPSGYETRVVAVVAVLSGAYRHSQRMVQSAMSEVFGIPMSLGT